MSFNESTKPKEYKNWRERWDWIVAFMVYEDLFVHELLLSMTKIPNKSIGTMGVAVKDNKLLLLFNPEFVMSLNDYELRFVVTHEIYHVVFHHCTKRQSEDPKERGLWNKAADLAINCLIPQSNQRYMPKDPELKGVEPKDFGFEEKLSMEQYIQLLREKGEDGEGNNGGIYGSQKGDKGNSKGNDKGDGKGDGDSSGGGEGDEEEPGELGGGFDNHDGWEENELIKEIVREKVRQLSRREKVWGSLPGELQGMIMAAQSSEVDWQRYLKHYIGELISAMKQSTFKRPNKRFGYPYSGTKRKYVDRKLVAIDTSGSVSDNDLAVFLAEVNRLAEIMPVDLVLFDHDIQTSILPFDRKHVRFDFKGRGGTSFDPVYKLAEENRYKSLIILTDGCAPCPPAPSFVKDILWVIIGEENDKPEGAVGTVIKIKEKPWINKKAA